jgi:argininosuccinate lyase
VKVNAARAADAVSDPMLLATDLADYLVKKNVPFRHAHEIIGKLVAHCVETQTSFPKLSPADFQKFSPQFGEDVFDLLDVRKAINARQAIGAPSEKNVAAQLQRWREMLDD